MKPVHAFHSCVHTLLALGLFAAMTSHANLIATDQPLRVTESAHFVFIYQRSLEPQLPNLIKAFEDAYTLLAPVFKYRTRGKIHILYDDSWDEHNGFATIFPRPLIAIYAGDVSPGSSIYEPGNFIRSTVFHEMAHLLPMNTQYGAGNVLTRIFGRVLPLGDPISTLLTIFSIPPNALAPEWYLEGLSIWGETEFAGPGRGRSSMADMIMRMPVVEDRLLSPAEWSMEHPEHPYGEAAYLYGMRAIQYAHDTYGVPRDTNAPGALADSVAHSFLYFFDGRAERVTGESFRSLAAKAMEKEHARQSANVALLKTVPLTGFRALTPERLQATHPTFGPDGRTVFFTANGEAERDTLYRYDLADGSLEKVSRARVQEGISRLASSPDRRTLYYTRLNYTGRDRIWNELRRHDVASGSTRRVTAQGRYRYPAISPDGRALAAVRNEAGSRVLLEVPLSQAGRRSAERQLAVAPPFHQLVDPVYAPDGRHLVYIRAGRDGSQLRRVDLRDGRDDLLASLPGIAMSPAFHPSGEALVFSADPNGVYNLYTMKPEPGATPRPITHVIGGAFMPDFSPDGLKLAFSTYDSHGYRLVVADAQDLAPIERPLPRLPDRWQTVPSNRDRIAAVEARPPPERIDSRSYNSLGAVRPDFWTPWLTASGDGAAGGLAASFSDPAGYQSLFLLGGYDSGFSAPVGSAVWSYSGMRPIFTLYGVYTADGYADLVRSTNDLYFDYSEHVGAGGLAMTLPFLGVDRQTYLSVGYQYADRAITDDARDDLEGVALAGTNGAPLYEGGEGAVWATLEFFNGTAFGRSLSIEDGRYLYAGIEQSASALGGELSRTRLLGQWHEFVSMPWAENHVLKLHAVGGAGFGDEIAQGFFGVGGFDSAQVSSTPAMPRNIGLRGYEMNYQVGKNVAKAGAAYRFPLFRLYRGATATLPIYLKQAFGEVFYEGGMAWDAEPEGEPRNSWLNAAGTEINFSTTLLRLLDIAPGIGIVYAFDREDRSRFDDDDDEEDDSKLQIYLSIKASISF